MSPTTDVPTIRRPTATPLFVEPEPPILTDSGGAPTAVLRLLVRGTMHSQAVYWGWDFACTTPGALPPDPAVPATDVLSLVQVFDATCTTPLLANLNSSIGFTDILVTQISSHTAAGKPVTATGWPKVGGVSGADLPQNVAICISKYSAFRGRRGRGRCYIGGVPPASIVTGTLTTVAHNNIAACFSPLFPGISAGGKSWVPVVTSGRVKKLSASPPAWETGIRGNQLITFAVQVNSRTQRRRNIGRGI
jgi:hypothetical protein